MPASCAAKCQPSAPCLAQTIPFSSPGEEESERLSKERARVPRRGTHFVKRRFLPCGSQGLLNGLKHRAGHRPDPARPRRAGYSGAGTGAAPTPARAWLPAAQAACGGGGGGWSGPRSPAQPGPEPSGAAPALPRRPGTRVGSGRGGGPGKRRSSGSSEGGKEGGGGTPARSHAGPGSAPRSRGHSHCLRSSRHKAMGDTKRGGGDRRDGGGARRGRSARPGSRGGEEEEDEPPAGPLAVRGRSGCSCGRRWRREETRGAATALTAPARP